MSYKNDDGGSIDIELTHSVRDGAEHFSTQ